MGGCEKPNFFMEFLFSTLLLFFALPYSIQFCAVNKFSSIRHQVARLFMLWQMDNFCWGNLTTEQTCTFLILSS